MSGLARTLIIKIALTVCLWCIPLLLFPATWLRMIGFPVPEPVLFLRLLGMAYVALVVAYAFGLRDVLRGEYPGAVVWVGIVSNGGAFALLLIAAIAGVLDTWGERARILMWISLLGTFAIAAALVWFGVVRRAR